MRQTITAKVGTDLITTDLAEPILRVLDPAYTDELVERYNKYDQLASDYDDLKTERDELKDEIEDLESRISNLEDDLRTANRELQQCQERENNER
jgi:uncharacterized coiled-coil DUF342 family protein